MTIKGRNRPRRSRPKTLDMDRFLAYQQPQAPTPPMMGTYRAPLRDMPQPQAPASPMPNLAPLTFYDKSPGMAMPTPNPRPRMPRTQRMPTVLPARRPAAPQGQFMMDRQGRPVRTVPFINKTGRG